MDINTTKVFLTKEQAQGEVMVGADFFMKILGYGDLSYSIKTSSFPAVKVTGIEYSSSHGVKQNRAGYLDTLNMLPITLVERLTMKTHKTLEQILLTDNGKLSIEFYTGRNLTEMRLWGKMFNASLLIEEGVEFDSENTTAPVNISAQLVGHYIPENDNNLIQELGLV